MKDFRNLEILKFSKQKKLNLSFHLSQVQLFINCYMGHAITGQF